MNRLLVTIACWIFLILGSASLASAQEAPVLAFSDLISGPSSGLGDGLGEGAIVTVWGYRLGDSPGRVIVTDNSGNERQAAHIYYWKKADGNSPGGPADLYESHRLYEVAFSIPNAPNGNAQITIETSTNQRSNALPFNIRTGNIFHVKPDGSNDSGTGSYDRPWQYVNGWDSRSSAPGNGRLNAGDIVYTHSVTEPVKGDSMRDVGMYLRGLNGTLDRQIAIASYPGRTSTVSSPIWGVQPYRSEGIVISKYILLGGMLDDPQDDRPTFGAGPSANSTIQVRTSKDGRIVGNYLSDIPGKCSNGLAGAIYSTRQDGSGVKAYGNFLHRIGCKQTSHFHHTTYMSKRTSDGQPASDAWEFGWNRFEENMAVFGIHFYDQSPHDSRDCDPVVGTFRIHNNYIRNQRGSAINVYTTDYDRQGSCWEADSHIFNNIMINVGLGPVAEINNGTQPYAISIGGDVDGDYYINNNLIYGISDQSARDFETPFAFRLRNRFEHRRVVIENNIVQTNFPMEMLRLQTEAQIQDDNNIWYTGGSEAQMTQTSFFSMLSGSAKTQDPKVIISNGLVALEEGSPAIGTAKGSQLQPTLDFYGRRIGATPNIGPLSTGTSINPPSPPSNIDIN